MFLIFIQKVQQVPLGWIEGMCESDFPHPLDVSKLLFGLAECSVGTPTCGPLDMHMGVLGGAYGGAVS